MSDGSCDRVAAAAIRFHAGASSLEEIDLLIEHVPSCSRCRELLDTLGRELGTVSSGWEELLDVYDPVRMLEQAASPEELPGHAPKLLVSIQGVIAARSLMNPRAEAPRFRSGAAGARWSGEAGEVRVMLLESTAGELELLATDPVGAPLAGALARFEAQGRVLLETTLDASGRAGVDEAVAAAFDALTLLPAL